jgi:hypothetical protein
MLIVTEKVWGKKTSFGSQTGCEEDISQTFEYPHHNAGFFVCVENGCTGLAF